MAGHGYESSVAMGRRVAARGLSVESFFSFSLPFRIVIGLQSGQDVDQRFMRRSGGPYEYVHMSPRKLDFEEGKEEGMRKQKGQYEAFKVSRGSEALLPVRSSRSRLAR